jgi:hypothetical protein
MKIKYNSQKTKINRFLLKFWPIIGITFLWLLFCRPYFVKHLVPFPSTYLVTFFAPWNTKYAMPVRNNAMPDVITQIYPWKKLTIDIWKSGKIPLWNPTSFSGTPHAANYQSAVFSPFNLIFLILPFIDAWSILILLQPLLAGIFMYLFIRELELSKFAAVFGAIGWMFSGFMTTWMAYGTLGYAILWLPFVLLGIEKVIKKSSITNNLFITIGIGLSFFSGHFQISIYLLGVVILYIIYQSYKYKSGKLLLKLLIPVLAALFICLIQILPSLDSYNLANRSSSIVKGEIIPWQYLITFIAPDFYGNPVTRNDWFGHYAEWGSYVGVLPLLFAIYGLAIGKIKKKLFFIGLFILAILLSYQSPLVYLMFNLKIPFLSTSAASRIIVLASFSLLILAAYGLDEFINQKGKLLFRSFFIPIFFMILILGFVWTLILFFHPIPAEWLIVAKRNFVLPSILIILGISLLFSKFINNKFFQLFIIILILLITSADMYRFSSKWMPFDERKYVYPNSPVISFLQTKLSWNRVFGNIGGEAGTTFSLNLIEGYDATYKRDYGRFIQYVSTGKFTEGGRSVVLLDKHGTYTTDALSFLGVKYILAKKSDGRNFWTYPVWEHQDTMKLIYSDDSYEVFENQEAYPRVYLTTDYKIVKDDSQILKTMFSPLFNKKETVLLGEKPIFNPGPGAGLADIISYKPNEIMINTSSDANKILFLSDVYDSGWKAEIDGVRVTVLKADYIFRAVSVPKGNHSVKFYYFPDSLVYGLWSMGFGIVLLFVYLVFNHKYENRVL